MHNSQNDSIAIHTVGLTGLGLRRAFETGFAPALGVLHTVHSVAVMGLVNSQAEHVQPVAAGVVDTGVGEEEEIDVI